MDIHITENKLLTIHVFNFGFYKCKLFLKILCFTQNNRQNNKYLDEEISLLPSEETSICVAGAVNRVIIPSVSNSGNVYACTMVVSVAT